MSIAHGGNGVHWYLAAMAHWRLGDKEKARELFDRRKTVRDTLRWHSAPADVHRLRAEAAGLLGVSD